MAKAAPDGYTLLLGGLTNVLIPLIYPKLNFDPVDDFAQIGLIADIPNVFVVNVDTPYKTLGDVVKAAKADPGSVSYASAGNGTPAHLVCELLASRTGIV